jgi:hypothetical protein
MNIFKIKCNYLIWSFYLLVTIQLLDSCIDPCKDKICYNGYCIEGDCFCQDGYSGVNCEIKESDKFEGTYTGNIICPEGSQAIKVKISNSTDDPRTITILHDNFGGKMTLRGKILKDSIFIPNQWVSEASFTNLFMPSKGILRNGSDLKYELIYYYSVDDIDTCRIEVKKN